MRWAVSALRARHETYLKHRNYYAGIHELMISQTRLRTIFGRLFNDFRLNLCAPVVDSLVDRLQVASFSAGGSPGDESEKASEIWARNRMQRRAGQTHAEAVSSGDAYILVWPNLAGDAVIYPHKSHEIAVEYDPESPGKIVRAAKSWREKGYKRLNLYYPDRVEKWRARLVAPGSTQGDNTPSLSEVETSASSATLASVAYERHTDDDSTWPLENRYEQVPVFHFANNADLGEFGVSELRDAVPVQDMLNYLVFNLLVGVEFQGFPQRYALNIEVNKDEAGNPISPFTTGPEKVWALTSPQSDQGERIAATLGQFEGADLEKLVRVKEDAALTMAQVTQTPVHYFQPTSNLVSGESQKTAEQKLDAKVRDREITFGDAWAALMSLALRMETSAAGGAAVELDTNWRDTKPRNELESWQIADLKASLGVSREQILREMGYDQEQIDAMKEEEGGTLGAAPALPSQLGPASFNVNGSSAGRLPAL